MTFGKLPRRGLRLAFQNGLSGRAGSRCNPARASTHDLCFAATG